MDQGIEQEGSNLSGVSAWCSWDEPGDNDRGSEDGEEEEREGDKENRRDEEREGRRGSDGERDRRNLSEYGKVFIKMQPTNIITKVMLLMLV